MQIAQKSYDHIYLSPHFDDVAICCGGTISKQCRAGLSVLVISIFTPPSRNKYPASQFAKHIEQIMGGYSDLFSVRCEENSKAIKALGAEPVWLDFEEAIYRGNEQQREWYYENLNTLFGSIHSAEQFMFQELADTIANIVNIDSLTTLYAPLGIGGHVDHRLIHYAARAMSKSGLRCKYYEDFPYADPNHPLTRSAAKGFSAPSVYEAIVQAGASSELSLFTEKDMHTKIRSVASYSSQLPALFGDEEGVFSFLSTYARYYEPQHYSERYWIFQED